MPRSRLTRRLRALGAPDLALAIYAAACLLLGGASSQGAIGNALLQLGAVGIIAWLALTPAPSMVTPPSRFFRALLAGLGVAAVLQLIPLPPALWSALPGRGVFADEYRLLGVAPPWLPLSLAPDRALASLLSLLPFLAALFLAMRTTAEGRVAFVWVCAAVAALSIAVGSAQLFSGGASRLYFYDITNRHDPVGFFANRNHLATLFLMTLPFIAALAARDARSERKNKAARRPLYIGAFLFLTFGTVLNGSSAGLALLVPCIGASALIYLRAIGHQPSAKVVMAVATVLAAGLIFAAAGPYHGRFLDKAINGGNSSTRGTSIALTAHAARDFLPLGSGVGSFEHIYTRYEDLGTLTNDYVNHAHNDWVEITLETGLMGVALLAGLVAWLLIEGRSLWAGTARTGSLARAALTALGLLMLHSLVDYPARTAAILCLAGAAVGMVAVPDPAARRLGGRATDEEAEDAPAARVFVAD